MPVEMGFSKAEEYSLIEDYLEKMMPLVSPRPDFIASLRERLMNSPPQRRWLPTVVFFTVLAVAGLISGFILIATSLRALFALIAALGVIYRLRFSGKGNSSSTFQVSS